MTLLSPHQLLGDTFVTEYQSAIVERLSKDNQQKFTALCAAIKENPKLRHAIEARVPTEEMSALTGLSEDDLKECLASAN